MDSLDGGDNERIFGVIKAAGIWQISTGEERIVGKEF